MSHPIRKFRGVFWKRGDFVAFFTDLLAGFGGSFFFAAAGAAFFAEGA